jgi:cobalt-zinc-cadmium efflux system membrane fusion protein
MSTTCHINTLKCVERLLCFLLLICSVSPSFGRQVSTKSTTGDLAVTVSPGMLQKLVIAPVVSTERTEVLRLPGRVALDEQRMAIIGPSISGQLTEIRAFVGQNVRKGDVLSTINSTELGNAQAAYLIAKSKVSLHRLSVDRARRLFESGVLSQVKLNERESELLESDIELRANVDRLRVMGMNEQTIRQLSDSGAIDSTMLVIAPLTGTVIERHASIGEIAQPSDNLFIVADLSRVWVTADAPEQDAHLIEPGGPAEVHIPALPGQTITGKLVYVSDTVNPVTRTVTVRMEVENPNRKIKPEMLATMIIHRAPIKTVTIPARAVVRQNDHDYVFVQMAPDRFDLRMVTLGPEQEGERQVLSGLGVGQQIVVEGAFHLNNERIRRELE